MKKDSNFYHNLKHCRAALVVSGRNEFPEIPLLPIQEFYARLQDLTYSNPPRYINYDKDVDFAHQIFINNGYSGQFEFFL